MFKVFRILWVVYLNLLPFYFFKSGLPQIADYFMVVLIIISSMMVIYGKVKLGRKYQNIVSFLLLFIAYIILSTSVWALIETNWDLFFHPIYYIYNFFVFIIILLFFGKQSRFLELTFYAIGISGLIQIICFIVLLNDFGVRQTIFFNNPNQLGYYALTSSCILALITRIKEVDLRIKSIFLSVFAVLVLLSLSKAAIISFFILIIIVLWNKPKMVVGFSILLLLFSFQFGSNLTESVTQRLENIGKQSDDSLEGRGYIRIINYPEYLFFGAAEGASIHRAYYNPNKVASDAEIHSSWGTILFSYGIIGTLLFLYFFYQLTRNNLVNTLYFIPLFLYGLTHHGLRFTQFWIFLALLSLAKFHRE